MADGGETDTPTRAPKAGDSDPEPNAGPALAAQASKHPQGTATLPPAGAGSGEWLSDLIRALLTLNLP